MATCSMQRPRFLEQVEAAEPGAQIVYHAGFLMRDRMDGSQFIEINSTACAAWDMLEAGKVTLSQTRVRPGEYIYRATKLAPPHKPLNWIGCYARFKTNTKPTRDPVVPAVVRERAPSDARTTGTAYAGSLARAA